VEIRPGVFAPAGVGDRTALEEVFATRSICDGEQLVTVQGAARIHGLWTPPSMPRAHRLSQPLAVVPAECIQHRGRLLVANREWTSLQLARWQRREYALIPLDSALAAGAEAEQLVQLGEHMRNWPGAAGLGRLLQLATGRSGSALESLSRGCMLQRRLPIPELQHRFDVRGRTYYADFFWPEFGLIGEADGMMKYEDRDAIVNEKARQSHLQGLGLRVFRWSWRDVHPDPAQWLDGLASALHATRTSRATVGSRVAGVKA
jgi:very-short-patch-repair endonuclease